MALKDLIIILLLLISCNQRLKSQLDKTKDYSKIKVYLFADVNTTGSAGDIRKDSRAGIGTLGVKFIKENVFGYVNFTGFTQNNEIETEDANEIKLFGSSILLPQNSAANLSNFQLIFGSRRFKLFDTTDNENPWNKKRFGFYFNFSSHNTIWKKDKLDSPITINSLLLNLSYTPLMMQLESNEDIILQIMAGITYRGLGGDYGLPDNDTLRMQFINTDKKNFYGLNLSARLEISKFFGQMSLTYNSADYDIKGFSGWQGIVSLGALSDIQFATK